MTTATEATSDADRYLKDVARHLGDLPDDERTELLDDLAQHLHEIAAEEGPPLRERLGPPDAYAAELLASAGVAPEKRRRGLMGTTRGLAARLRESSIGREAVRLEPALRPAWWVARAYLAVSLLAAFLSGGSDPGFPIPEPLGSRLLGLVAIILAVPLSVRLGQRTPAGRRAVVAANVVLAVFGLTVINAAGAADVRYVDSGVGPAGYRTDGCLRSGEGERITNLYAYDTEGRLLDPVLLYDQDGRPIDNLCPDFDERGQRLLNEYRSDANGAPVINAFPRRQAVLGTEPGGRPIPGAQTGQTTPVRPPAVVVPRLSTTATTTTSPTLPSG